MEIVSRSYNLFNFWEVLFLAFQLGKTICSSEIDFCYLSHHFLTRRLSTLARADRIPRAKNVTKAKSPTKWSKR